MSSPRDTTVTVLLDHHIPTPTVFYFGYSVTFWINHTTVLFINL
jgi:hypothetical protein